MVIDLVMVTAPKPPGSRQLISPPVAVLEMAPAKVLHGAVRLHGLTSSPTPETQVRVAWALADPAANVIAKHEAVTARKMRQFMTVPSNLIFIAGRRTPINAPDAGYRLTL
jgi:hypothetical protein